MRRKLPNKYNGNCLTHADLEVATVLGIRIGAAPSEAVLAKKIKKEIKEIYETNASKIATPLRKLLPSCENY